MCGGCPGRSLHLVRRVNAPLSVQNHVFCFICVFLFDFFQYSFYYFLRIGVIIRIEYDNMYFCCKFLHACIAIISMFSAFSVCFDCGVGSFNFPQTMETRYQC